MKVRINRAKEIGTFVGNVLVRDENKEVSGLGRALYLFVKEPFQEAEICLLPSEHYNDENVNTINQLMREIVRVGYPERDENFDFGTDREGSGEGDSE